MLARVGKAYCVDCACRQSLVCGVMVVWCVRGGGVWCDGCDGCLEADDCGGC